MPYMSQSSITCAGSVVGGCALFCVLWLLGDLLGAALLTKVFTLPCTALIHSQARGYIRRKYGIQVTGGHLSRRRSCLMWTGGGHIVIQG